MIIFQKSNYQIINLFFNFRHDSIMLQIYDVFEVHVN